ANGVESNATGVTERLNGPLVNEETASSSVQSSTPLPSTSANTQTPKNEEKRELTPPPPRPPPPPGAECVFDLMEMRKHLKPVLTQLDQCNASLPFKVPVDPLALNIPDYLDIVQHPMDLSTMNEKLRSGRYRNPWQFCDDMWLMFENAWLYNRKTSKVYNYTTQLSELFIKLIDPVMENMGYCCGQKRSFTPPTLFCYGASMCTIGKDETYYWFVTKSNSYGVTVSERYTYCAKCYVTLPEEGISISDDPNDKSRMVLKEDFKQFKNDVVELEPFETCTYCFRKWHKICALHDKKVYPEGFICKTCRKENRIPLPNNPFLAKNLECSKLSNHLEERVNRFIKSKGSGNQVIIRVLSVAEKEIEVKPLMKSKYCDDTPSTFPQKIPYKTKAIFAFEVIDGVEVCFFGLHVQEYGSGCPSPNQRRVNIAFLDSVHYFEPKKLRTDVYHEILLGYLDYARKLGYTMAHISACPPSEGEDVVFHCRPTD
ncbi:hypothetical protein PMAYCL1PPCAC_11461, partial [Pristionchus mayeri]